MNTLPEYTQFEHTFFTDANLQDSSSIYKIIRDTGDATWSPELNAFVVGRYEDVKKGLRADDILISSQGVGLNAQLNDGNGPNLISTISSDGDQHKRLRLRSMKPLTPAAIKSLESHVTSVAQTQVKALINSGTTEGVETLAFFIPINIVCDLVGIKGVDSQRMMSWSDAMFNSTGPESLPRTMSNMPAVVDFSNFMAPLTRDDVIPGSWADELLAAGERGELSEVEARGVLMDYIVPSLDTTAQAITELLYQLSQNTDTLGRLRERPELIPSAVLEAVRLATPIRGFTRKATQDFSFSETTIPKDSRVWLINASANRDERHYENPDVFDIERNAKDQLAWGHGTHLCLGKHLAILEMETLLRALIDHVERVEITHPKRLVHNMIQGYASLPTKLVAR